MVKVESPAPIRRATIGLKPIRCKNSYILELVTDYLDFAEGIAKPALIFSVNYFLKGKDGRYLNGMLDKKVWMLWAELRVHGDVEAIETPTGLIPKYEDLAGLFKRELGTDYIRESYIEQFTTRVPNLLAKIGRVEEIYKAKVPDTPQIVFDVFNRQRERLNAAKDKFGECISPFDL